MLSLSRQSFATISPLTSRRISLKPRPATAGNPGIGLANKYIDSADIVQRSNETHKSEGFSSGGSENSFPPINLSRQDIKVYKSSKCLRSTTSPAIGTFSKFCHECGNKFIVETAKFCMECGIRRMVM